MAFRVPLNRVDNIRHLSVRGAFLTDPGDPTTIVSGLEGTAHTPDGEHETAQAAMEVYTGWVVPNFVVGGSTDREEARLFLPIARNRVKFYPDEDNLLGFTVAASPATIEPAEDEAVIVGVDGAPSVKLEPQTFGGIGGNPLVLVLRVLLVGLNVSFHRFTYQVTVLTKEDEEITEQALPGGSMPA